MNSITSLFTRLGIFDPFIDLIIGATPDDDGIYHISQNWWQQYFGYDDLYDDVFDRATSMNAVKFEFDHKGDKFMLWAWKGDYMNLGAGAELGIYFYKKGITFDWTCGTQYKMPMTLTLYHINQNSTKKLFSYAPADQLFWWITGFSPKHPNVQAAKLKAVYQLDFSNSMKSKFPELSNELPELYKSFKAKYGKDKRWDFSTEFKPVFTFFA
ncbi:MAG: DUF4474 domain-containing protein [Endomicrobia bacterium]|nr:DUF4474 domain-containing protein [Endomicrobiia bacterium]